MATTDWELMGRIAVSFVLAFLVGWEREARGAVAGDRTFALVGTAAAAVVALFGSQPNTVAGVMTGVGFIGGGLVMRGEHGVKGITTAATIWAVSAVGVAAGGGHLALATAITGLILLTLEISYVPGLRELDARRHVGATNQDEPTHGPTS
jgi:putative Mg2+ transporter-C (MgtC) family protein